MSQSLSRIYIHLVFSTKDRRSILADDIRPALNSYSAGILKQCDSPALIINGIADHIHVLLIQSKNHAISKIVEELKKGTSKWLKEQSPNLADFQWQGGYGAFSVSASNVDRVYGYIENQESHHRKVSFQDELRALLKKHGVSFDERYLWT